MHCFRRGSMNKKISFGKIVSIVILLFFCFICIIPIIAIISISLSDEMDIVKNGYSLIPKKISFEAYAYMFKGSAQILRSYVVSITLTAVSYTHLDVYKRQMVYQAMAAGDLLDIHPGGRGGLAVRPEQLEKRVVAERLRYPYYTGNGRSCSHGNGLVWYSELYGMCSVADDPGKASAAPYEPVCGDAGVLRAVLAYQADRKWLSGTGSVENSGDPKTDLQDKDFYFSGILIRRLFVRRLFSGISLVFFILYRIFSMGNPKK